jgi:hypothetical protein
MIVKDDQRQHFAIDVPAALVSRVRSEYLEMPGLRLTTWQAACLWASKQTCRSLCLPN